LEGFPDKRRGTNTTYRMADFGMAAFSAFFMQSPSFLDFQRPLESEHARSNCQTLFDIPKILTDNQIRDMLDPAEPELLHPVFAEPVAILEGANGGLAPFWRLGDHVLIALEGTEYFSSKKIHCHNCSTRQRGKGEKEYFHAMLGATLVAPGHDKVIPLEPEFIAPQDGAEKQDCENAAAKRWLAAHGAQYARLNPIYLGDDLFSRQPLCADVLAVGGHFIFVCKPSSHPLIQEYLTGVNLQTHEETIKRGKNKVASSPAQRRALPGALGDKRVADLLGPSTGLGEQGLEFGELPVGDVITREAGRPFELSFQRVQGAGAWHVPFCGRTLLRRSAEPTILLRTTRWLIRDVFVM